MQQQINITKQIVVTGNKKHLSFDAAPVSFTHEQREQFGMQDFTATIVRRAI
jgi:hypothetical protein